MAPYDKAGSDSVFSFSSMQLFGKFLHCLSEHLTLYLGTGFIL